MFRYTPFYFCYEWVRGFRVFQTQMLDNEIFPPPFVTAFLVRGYHISGHKTPQPVLRPPFDRMFFRSFARTYANDTTSLKAFARTCRSTLEVQDMVAGYEPSEAPAKCPESVSYPQQPSGRREFLSITPVLRTPIDRIVYIIRL